MLEAYWLLMCLLTRRWCSKYWYSAGPHDEEAGCNPLNWWVGDWRGASAWRVWMTLMCDKPPAPVKACMQNKHPRLHGRTLWLQDEAALAASARSRLQLVSTCYQNEPRFWNRSTAMRECEAFCFPLINEPFAMRCVQAQSGPVIFAYCLVLGCSRTGYEGLCSPSTLETCFNKNKKRIILLISTLIWKEN